tara:strand:- start:198 stop:395 length:198 start_codon:yes stop_codon:yes gene_type:complete
LKIGDSDIMDYPLFMTDGEPIAINIHSRNEETGEFEVESRPYINIINIMFKNGIGTNKIDELVLE